MLRWPQQIWQKCGKGTRGGSRNSLLEPLLYFFLISMYTAAELP